LAATIPGLGGTRPGTAFVDTGHGHVHSAYNPTDGVTVIVATFFESPAEGSLLIPADTPACAA
jgi:hypothetical protein